MVCVTKCKNCKLNHHEWVEKWNNYSSGLKCKNCKLNHGGRKYKNCKLNHGGQKCKNCKMKHGWAKMQKLQNESSKYQAHGVFEKAQNFLSNFLSNFGKNAAFLCDLF